jgi:hypothetical protein
VLLITVQSLYKSHRVSKSGADSRRLPQLELEQLQCAQPLETVKKICSLWSLLLLLRCSSMRASLKGALLVFAPLLPVLVAAWNLMHSSNNDAELRQQLLASFGLSLLGFAGTVALVPEFTKFLSKKGLTGKDLCKKGMEGGDKPMLVFQSNNDL